MQNIALRFAFERFIAAISKPSKEVKFRAKLNAALPPGGNITARHLSFFDKCLLLDQ
ncbi:hypothetical protein [Acinetobacter bouvetii]|uniref:hypothetical protein n=1 Tax=Acinetobacter bouvetii TaxID=202951 RepID=UPI0012B5F713|nr:hypothetical protein [Acinetobacter bouvetii]